MKILELRSLIPVLTVGFLVFTQAQDTVNVIFLGEQMGTHGEAHDGAAVADALQEKFAENDLLLKYTPDRTVLNPDTLGNYDVLMLYDNIPGITPAQDSAVYQFVEQGGGFVAIHQGITYGTYALIPQLLGAKFSGHGTGEFTTEIIDDEHPANKDVESYTAWDESYFFTDLSDDRTVLVRRPETAGAPEPEDYAWVRTEGEGRVYYSAAGHDDRVWSQAGFMNQLTSAVMWTSGKRDSISDTIPTLILRRANSEVFYKKRFVGTHQLFDLNGRAYRSYAGRGFLVWREKPRRPSIR